MALTGLTNLQPLHIKTVGIGTFDNAVSIGGTLTYEDVTNVDAIGIITARSGINVSGGQLDVGSNIKLGNAGVITATSFVGSGSGLTGLNSDLVNDSSPQLGGALDVNGNNIQSGNAIFQIVLNQRHKFYSGGNQIIDINGNGVDFLHGNNTHADNVKSQFGASNDLQIFCDGTHSSIKNTNASGYINIDTDNFRVRDGNGSLNIIRGFKNADVELYFNNEEKLFTKANGVQVQDTTATGAYLTMATSSGTAGKLYATGDNTLGFLDSQNHYMLKGVKDGTVELYYNNSKKLDTVSTGIRVHGDEGGTAQLQLLADQGDDNPDYWRIIAETDGTLNMQDYGSGNWYNNIRLTGHTGGVILFQNNDAKFQTQSDGVRVEDGGHLYLHNDSENSSSYIRNTDSSNNSNIAFYTREGGSGNIRWNVTKSGQFIPNANNSYDIGDTTNRVRNIYTNDLNLSNKGSTNSVDNTWGDYTIQEGESDLFLINNRNGKKYKFNLTEVS